MIFPVSCARSPTRKGRHRRPRHPDIGDLGCHKAGTSARVSCAAMSNPCTRRRSCQTCQSCARQGSEHRGRCSVPSCLPVAGEPGGYRYSLLRALPWLGRPAVGDDAPVARGRRQAVRRPCGRRRAPRRSSSRCSAHRASPTRRRLGRRGLPIGSAAMSAPSRPSAASRRCSKFDQRRTFEKLHISLSPPAISNHRSGNALAQYRGAQMPQIQSGSPACPGCTSPGS
jgi:hypothetical protein